MELKMMFYLIIVAIVVNMSQPSIRIGGGLHALIHLFIFTGGLKAPNRFGTLRTRRHSGNVRATESGTQVC